MFGIILLLIGNSKNNKQGTERVRMGFNWFLGYVGVT